MTIAELHDYCRYLFDENHVHGVPDKWSEGYEFALSLVMFKCHEGLTDEDRKAVAEWRENMWRTMLEAALQRFLEERKDEIIDKAANMLADRFQRTKKYREAMGAAIGKDGE